MNDFQPYDCPISELREMIAKNQQALTEATRDSVFYQMTQNTIAHLENVLVFREKFD